MPKPHIMGPLTEIAIHTHISNNKLTHNILCFKHKIKALDFQNDLSHLPPYAQQITLLTHIARLTGVLYQSCRIQQRSKSPGRCAGQWLELYLLACVCPAVPWYECQQGETGLVSNGRLSLTINEVPFL